jgi:1-acyl-sn-glycerol-3-phosphate acyltransferase
LVQRYFVEPYRFIPPYRGTFWCRVGRYLMPRRLRRLELVERWQFQGKEHLDDSLGKRAGILLASNHCRSADPPVLGMLSLACRRFFYYLVSYHLFKTSRSAGWWIRRFGGYSVLREGADREAIRTTSSLLAEGQRPIVIFPEGTWFRQNDRLGPLQEGISLMVRQALKQAERPILVHPVAVKYWALADPQPALSARLDRLEARLGWQSQRRLDFLPRLEKLGNALLVLKEIEVFGQPGSGVLDERIRKLAEGLVASLEEGGREAAGSLLERVRRVRLRLVKQLAGVGQDQGRAAELHQGLERLLLAENLNAHSLEYLASGYSLERLIETVQRIEETIEDTAEVPVVPTGAVLAIGPAIDVRALPIEKPARSDPDPLVKLLGSGIQGLLDQMLAKGPPPEWHCPPPLRNCPV